MRREDVRRREGSAISAMVMCKRAQRYQLEDGIDEIEREESIWWGKFRPDDGTHGREQPGER
jgi:hypothetical protein